VIVVFSEHGVCRKLDTIMTPFVQFIIVSSCFWISQVKTVTGFLLPGSSNSRPSRELNLWNLHSHQQVSKTMDRGHNNYRSIYRRYKQPKHLSAPKIATIPTENNQHIVSNPTETKLVSFKNVLGTFYYTGESANRTPQGYGTIVRKDSTVFTGTCNQGSLDGFGEYLYKDGSTYFGEWKQGMRHGLGTFIGTSGLAYRGEWKDDKMDGKGELTLLDGSQYAGEFSEGEICGLGAYRSSTGEIQYGHWTMSRLVEGRVSFLDGSSHDVQCDEGDPPTRHWKLFNKELVEVVYNDRGEAINFSTADAEKSFLRHTETMDEPRSQSKTASKRRAILANGSGTGKHKRVVSKIARKKRTLSSTRSKHAYFDF
jgi:hypothetical protein